MTDLKAYLAEKYMSGAKADAILSRVAPKKKKKRKAEASSSHVGTRLVDEDGGWGGNTAGDDEEDLAEAVVEKDRGFKKRRVAAAEEGSGWATIQPGIKEETPPPPEDEQPTVVEEVPTPFMGGLLTADQLHRAIPETKTKEEMTREEEAAQETIYRDASGKKIDTKAERAEAQRKRREREEREAKKMEWGKGLVQRDEQEKRRLEFEKQKDRPFARHADDKELNEELRAQERWNDPAAAFLTKKTSKGPRKPQYTGPPPPPNRFEIKPGYRWDGVDRGNGFEKKFFQHQNDRKRSTLASYEWSVDDM